MTGPLRIVALISGGGRTVLNLQRAIREDALPAEITRVIGSRPGLAGLERASRSGLPTSCPDPVDCEEALERLITREAPDLICLCGYLRHLRIRPDWHGRVINIHPSLLPRHGGRGMFGLHVHRSVLAAGETVSGCTVHYVDDEYDHGPVLLQRTCPVRSDDSPETLAARVFEEECRALPEAISLIAHGRVRLVGTTVEGRPDPVPSPQEGTP